MNNKEGTVVDTKISRPEVVEGTTYKIRPGGDDAIAIYMTINDVDWCQDCGGLAHEKCLAGDAVGSHVQLK